MNFAKQHVHKCRTRGCEGIVTHFDDMCPDKARSVLCTPCMYLEQMPATGRAASDWNPWEDGEQPKATESD